MATKTRSAKPYNIIAAIIFIASIGSSSYMGVYDWLPSLSIACGLALLIRQLLLRHMIDVVVILIVFGMCFLSSFTQFFARLFFPTFLIIGAVYYIIRQFVVFHEKVVVKAGDIHIEKEGK